MQPYHQRTWPALFAPGVSLGGAPPPLPVGRRAPLDQPTSSPPGPDLDALRPGVRAQAPALAAPLVDGARGATLDVLGDAEAPPRSRPTAAGGYEALA